MKIKLTMIEPKLTIDFVDVEDFTETEHFVKFSARDADGSRFVTMLPINNIAVITLKEE